jgi:hypothetical protein
VSKKKIKYISQQDFYVTLRQKLRNSPEYKMLAKKNPTAIIVLVEFIALGRNGNEFYKTYTDINKMGISNHMYSKSIAALVEVGFVVVIERGGKQLKAHKEDEHILSWGTNKFKLTPKLQALNKG